jgi:hypothetical protein
MRLDGHNACYSISIRAGFVRVGRFKVADELLFRSLQTPVAMRFGARLAGAKLTLLARLRATDEATNGQG